ncbi:heterokaryon incompatibility protein-domain-containing protein [Podospora didyma]|uniref:Heterokaryon incompatibility protein-domain-containing protein n=1 Tax=Podospora didyma TaxID=330526 RepID=A0AAE0P0Y2_9PEZI|nr:heterokaryon incompatibility protein-domain-containing protein [Podospora didyma]
MWVDAICINQTDLHEKEGQLVLMRNIYEQAEQVCVWLGEPAEGSVIAIENLQDSVGFGVAATLGKSVANTYMTHLSGPSSPIRNPTNGISWGWSSQLDMEVNIGDLRELLTRPWWTRVWVVQEVVVGRAVVFMVGSDTFAWANVERSLDRERKNMSLLHVPSATGPTQVFGTVLNPEVYSAQDETFRMMSRFRQLWKDGTFRLSIYELLYEFRRLNCTNPRDRVFAFLGLATAGGRELGIVPDYSNSTAEVFIQTTLSVINSTNSLDILNCVREWRGIEAPPSPAYAFSLLDQAKYHDVGAKVSDGPGTRPRRAWARLPPGWERIPAHAASEGKNIVSWSGFKSFVKGETARYYNHNTGTTHGNSPLEGKLPLPLAQHPARQREIPDGWVKTWDNLGRASVRYAPKPPPLPPQPTATAETAAIPSTESPFIIIPLPTWVPNWHTQTHIDPRPFLNWTDNTTRYAASGSTAASISYRRDNNSLVVDGVLFDTVVALSSPWHPNPAHPPITRRGAPALIMWENLALDTSVFSSPCPYASTDKGDREEAFWRTQIADFAGDNTPASDENIRTSDDGNLAHHLETPSSLPSPPLLAPRDSGVARMYMEAWYDQHPTRGSWAKHLPSIDDTASHNLWQLADMSIDGAKLYWDLHAELRRIAESEGTKIETAGSEDVYGEYLRRICEACGHRRLLITGRGYMGLAPWNAKIGDKVCVLKGGKTPFLLREEGKGDEGEDNVHSFVGEAYVYGIMGGEAMPGGKNAEGKMQSFCLM